SERTAAGCYLHGQQSWKEGGDHLAKEWYEKAIQKDSSFWNAYTALGQIELGAGHFERAKKLFEKSIRLNADDGWAMYYLAKADVSLGQNADALEMAYHSARHAESAAAAYHLAGTILLRGGKVAEAAKAFKQALDYDNHNVAAHDLLACALSGSGNVAGALE